MKINGDFFRVDGLFEDVLEQKEIKLKNSEEIALITNIQKYSLQDGPGIRTSVFFKGCPLRCRWCSNPESWNNYSEIIHDKLLCVQCRTCINVCPLECILFDEKSGKPCIDTAVCDLCLKCVESCPQGALKVMGEYMYLDDVMKEIMKDEMFYHKSGGGVTLSGGEVLLQNRFAVKLLQLCKQEYISTAIDTTGHADWSVLEELIKYTDLALYDIKHLDSKKHKEWTGVGNEKILENAPKTAKATRVWIRIPVIPSFNDDKENILKTAEFAYEIGAEKLTLLGYHELGKMKFESLNRPYSLTKLSPTKESVLRELKKMIETQIPGLNVTIGF